MVARTAFEQLNHSAGPLVAMVVAMAVIFVVPPVAVVTGIMAGNIPLALADGGGLLAMIFAYRPTLQLYLQRVLSGLTLPTVGFLFTLMTIDSARRHWTGQGGQWKGRSYQRLLRGAEILQVGG
jgi:hypothetical protein